MIAGDAVLHLPLNEVTPDGHFLDASGRHAATTNNVELVPDDVFGACAAFDGDKSYLEVTDHPDLQIEGDMTVESWFCLTEEPTDYVAIVAKGPPDRRNYCLWYHKGDDYSLRFQRYVNNASQHCTIPASFVLKRNTWYHIAGVLQGTAASVVIHDVQGNPMLDQPQEAVWKGTATPGAHPLRLGNAGYYGAHNGKLANVRIYRRALSPGEIAAHIRMDLLGTTAFRKTHPIDFRVYDDDEAPVIYITDDATGSSLNVELLNTSGQPIRLGKTAGTQATPANHHFALRFRRGTLSDKAIGSMRLNAEGQTEWDVSVPQPSATHDDVSIYALYKNTPKEWRAGERRVLTLERVSAAAGSGSRGTQVQLVPNEACVAYADAGAAPITGSRTQYVHVTSHIGKRNIPLHVTLMPSNRVLNVNGEKNKLTIRITNASRDPISLTPATRFRVFFDVTSKDVPEDWALTTAKAAEDVNVDMEVKPGEPKTEGTRPPGTSGEWELKVSSDTRIDPRGHVDIDIRNVVSSLPNGSANIYLRYEKIVGYWDGQFVCTVERGPIFIDKNKVGIGLREAKEALDVVGSVNVSEVVNARSLTLVEAAKPLSAPQSITLQPNWAASARNASGHEYFDVGWWKDALGMIHFSGFISHFPLPPNASDRLVALRDYAPLFELPPACAPAFGHKKFLAAYAEFDNGTQRAIPVHVQERFRRADAAGGLYDPVVMVSVEYDSIAALLQNVTGVHCALDGISYPARS